MDNGCEALPAGVARDWPRVRLRRIVACGCSTKGGGGVRVLSLVEGAISLSSSSSKSAMTSFAPAVENARLGLDLVMAFVTVEGAARRCPDDISLPLG